MSFKSCIEDARARGEISNEEADDLIRRFSELSRRLPPRAARDELARQLAVAGAEQRRRDLLAAKATDQLLKDVMQYRGPKGERDMREAMFSLFEDHGYAGYPSVKYLRDAYIGMANSQMADFLEHFRRSKLPTGHRLNKVDLKEVRKALYGEKVSPQNKAFADAFSQVAEQLRQLFNERGGAIPKREDWGMPQSHDENAVIRAGKAKSPEEARRNWINFIDPLLNWKKMFDPFTGELFPEIPSVERRQGILGHVWESIVTNGQIERTPSKQRYGAGSVATQRADHRFLSFKDAESSERYDREFGKNNTFAQMMQHIHSMASDIALMERFGPNPASMVEYMKQMLDDQGARVRTGRPNMLDGYDHTTVNSKMGAAKNVLDAFYQQYRGIPAGQNWVALAGTILRNQVTASLLGSSVIPHATSNWYIQLLARRIGGVPAARLIPELIRALGGASHAEMLRAGLDVENGAFSMGTGARQLRALAKVANWSRWLPDRTTNVFGLQAVVNANKGSFFRGMMSMLADLQSKDWDALPERVRRKMEGYGLNERDWKVMQLARQYEPSIGSAKWLRPNEVNAVGAEKPQDVLTAAGRPSLDPTQDEEAARKIAFATSIKMLTYMHGEREVAVPQSSMRAHAKIYGAADDTSWWGQLRRSFGLFKGFIGSFMITQWQAMQHELARNKLGGAAFIASLVTGMTIAGMASLQLKQLAAGKDMLNMNPTTERGLSTWMRALLTGGSFGIFGDFIASEHSSYGWGPLETLAGPIAALPLGLATGTLDLIRSVAAGTQRKPWRGLLSDALLKYLKGNTPLLSTGWPIRAAYNRIFLDTLQYQLDPSAHMKQRELEDRLRKETGQGLWWRPGETWPSRFPTIAPSH